MEVIAASTEVVEGEHEVTASKETSANEEEAITTVEKVVEAVAFTDSTSAVDDDVDGLEKELVVPSPTEEVEPVKSALKEEERVDTSAASSVKATADDNAVHHTTSSRSSSKPSIIVPQSFWRHWGLSLPTSSTYATAAAIAAAISVTITYSFFFARNRNK